MKNAKILLLLILVSAGQLYSQNYNGIGVKFGLGIANIDNQPNDENNYLKDWFKNKRLGPSMGVFVDFNINKFIRIDLELNYLQKGAEDEFEITTIEQPQGTGETYSIDHQLDYLQLILTIGPKLSLTGIDLFLKFGPSINYLLGTRGLYIFKDTKELTFGINFGVGIIIHDLLKNSVLIEIDRDVDLQPFLSNSTYDLTNRIWIFKIGFYYN